MRCREARNVDVGAFYFSFVNARHVFVHGYSYESVVLSYDSVSLTSRWRLPPRLASTEHIVRIIKIHVHVCRGAVFNSMS